MTMIEMNRISNMGNILTITKAMRLRERIDMILTFRLKHEDILERDNIKYLDTRDTDLPPW